MAPIRTKLLVAFLLLTAISLFQTVASLKNLKTKNQLSSLSSDLDNVSKKVLELYKFEKDLLTNEVLQNEFKSDRSPSLQHIQATLEKISTEINAVKTPERLALSNLSKTAFNKAIISIEQNKKIYENKLAELVNEIVLSRAQANPSTSAGEHGIVASLEQQLAVDEQVANLYQSVEQLQTTIQSQLSTNDVAQTRLFIALGFLLLFSSIVLSFVFSNRISNPIIDLSNEVKKFSQNGFTSNLSSPAAKSTDELRQLKQNIYGMGIKFQETLEELRQSNERLKASNAHLQRFAHIVSHDLRAPLRTIHSFLGLLKRRMEGKMDEKGNSYLGFVQEGAMKMNQLIKDILEFSKVDTQSINLKECDLQPILQEVLDFNDFQITERAAKINIDNSFGI